MKKLSIKGNKGWVVFNKKGKGGKDEMGQEGRGTISSWLLSRVEY